MSVLRGAAPACDLRNVLVHGHWWRFNPATQTMTVRREKLWRGQRRFVRVTVVRMRRAEQVLLDAEQGLRLLTLNVFRKDEVALLRAVTC